MMSEQERRTIMKKRVLWISLVLTTVGLLFWPSSKLEPQSADVTLIGAGDIADALDFQLSGAVATAGLLAANPAATVFADGDLSHNDGTDGDIAKSYGPTWGQFKTRTIPVLGNHEYFTLKALGYFDYWGPTAGDPTKGYYSLNLGAWHIIVLNSNCGAVGCGKGGAQDKWLLNDLSTHSQLCTLALWHEPLYTSSSSIAPNTNVQPFWKELYSNNVDLIINGHAHNYERFAPQDASGNLDPARGIIEIVAGTGGASHFAFNSTLAPNSLVQDATTYGVVKLTLHQSSFDWQFIPVAGHTFTDSGTQACH
ncbi:MAG: alkaline phosphatase [Acidobacteria bacterium]|nr:MAG: alkaline phosphatase [Acidobacteriota bacterium]